jgi:hypothetical protein
MICVPSNIKLIFFALVFIFGCKHASLKDIQGKIVDADGDPVAGASVVLEYHIPRTSALLNKYPNASVHEMHYDSTVTDASGKYHFNRRKKMRWEHWLVINHPSYGRQEFDLGYEKNAFTARLEWSVGYLSIRVKKKTSAPGKINITFNDGSFTTLKNSSYDTLICQSKVIKSFNGYTISWTVNDTSYFSSVGNLQKGEHKTFLIEYD